MHLVPSADCRTKVAGTFRISVGPAAFAPLTLCLHLKFSLIVHQPLGQSSSVAQCTRLCCRVHRHNGHRTRTSIFTWRNMLLAVVECAKTFLFDWGRCSSDFLLNCIWDDMLLGALTLAGRVYASKVGIGYVETTVVTRVGSFVASDALPFLQASSVALILSTLSFASYEESTHVACKLQTMRIHSDSSKPFLSLDFQDRSREPRRQSRRRQGARS